MLGFRVFPSPERYRLRCWAFMPWNGVGHSTSTLGNRGPNPSLRTLNDVPYTNVNSS